MMPKRQVAVSDQEIGEIIDAARKALQARLGGTVPNTLLQKEVERRMNDLRHKRRTSGMAGQDMANREGGPESRR